MTTKVVDDETLGQLARKQYDLFRRVREGSLPADRVLRELQAMIEGRSPNGDFRTWKIIEIGGYSLANGLLEDLREASITVDDVAQSLMMVTSLSDAKRELELVRATVQDLGFEKPVKIDAILRRAERLGLSACPAEVGPQLRRQYMSQVEYELIYIAMKPLPMPDGEPAIFCLAHTCWVEFDEQLRTLELRADISSGASFPLTSEWIFTYARPE